MLILGLWIERRVRTGWTQVMAEIAASYLEALVAPLVQDLELTATLSPEQRSALKALISDGSLGNHIRVVKIWRTDGSLLMSTADENAAGRLRPTDLGQLMAGRILAPTRRHVLDTAVDDPVIEIYAPIYSRKSSQIIAIGEFYKEIDHVSHETKAVRLSLWLLIAAIGTSIGLMMYGLIRHTGKIIARQRELLESHVARLATLARRNNALRQHADRARITAVVTNEEYLSRIGADLHDGPIQMLSLLMLKLPAETQGTPAGSASKDLRTLVEQTLAELRSLSTGLVLPQIRDLTPEAMLEAAAAWHERHTGTKVARNISPLPEHMPEAIRVCAFRVVQEALMNAFKHAEGRGQVLRAHFANDTLHLLVQDDGPSQKGLARTGGLGLQGLRTRVHALRGALRLTHSAQGGTRVSVRLPVRPRSLSATID